MNNETVLIRALNSVLYDEAKSAIRIFYRTAKRQRVELDDAVAKGTGLSAEGEKSGSFVDQLGREWFLTKQNSRKLEIAKEETKSVSGTEVLSGLVCPKCGDSMQQSTICPACKDGQAGFRVRHKCVCGFELVGRVA